MKLYEEIVDIQRDLRSIQVCYVPASFFGYLNGEQRFTPLTELRTLGDEAQPVEVHVRTTYHCYETLVGAVELILCYIPFQARQTECTGWFSDGPCF